MMSLGYTFFYQMRKKGRGVGSRGYHGFNAQRNISVQSFYVVCLYAKKIFGGGRQKGRSNLFLCLISSGHMSCDFILKFSSRKRGGG